MSISFQDLVTTYRKLSSWNDDKSIANYKVNNTSDLKLINNILNSDNFENSQIEVIEGEPSLQKTIKLRIGQPNLALGILYKTFDEFLIGDFQKIHNSHYSEKPFFIQDIDYFSVENKKNEEIESYQTIKKLFYCLEKMSSYSDKLNKKLIFFSKNVINLNYSISTTNISDFKLLLKSLTKQQKETIDKFCIWFEDQNSATHISEKKSILSQVLLNFRNDSTEINLTAVVEDIEYIFKSIKGQYELYIENFKYDKYVQKLEEKSDKFIEHVNTSISKVITQILGLPIAVAISAVLKGTQQNNNWIIYCLVIIYALICFFALNAQKATLDHIKKSVKEYSDKLPQYFNESWNKEEKHINNLIQKQMLLYWVMCTTVGLAILYAGWNIIHNLFCINPSI
ncbi:hypothetical protein VH441_05270 [Psychrobacter sp. HD31]|uniref:hypothetical protein n=1 Tax=Psychrobacter sp. HD31 TaxID=3112003 RepID=UPI003DA4AD56